MTMPDRRDASPIIIRDNGTSVSIERLQLDQRELAEGADLRDFVFQNPACLPVGQLDPSYCPIIPIGTEIETDAGPIDCLFIAPSGLLTIVETKLWRNPQARREVVGQILDYAKEVSRWSYSELDLKCRQKTGKVLWQLVRDRGLVSETNGEQSFVDQTARALRDGRFLLLIVGDGIREDVERMAVYLQAAPQLLFSLHLIELQVYRLPSGGRLVVPQLVARTKEVVRAVVHVQSLDSNIQVNVDVPREDAAVKNGGKPDPLSEARFIEQLAESSPEDIAFVRKLLNDVATDDRLTIDWHTASFSIKARDAIAPQTRYPLLYLDVNGNASLWSLREKLEKVGLPVELADKYASETAAMVGTLAKNGSWSPAVPISRVAANYDKLRSAMSSFLEEVYAQRRNIDHA